MADPTKLGRVSIMLRGAYDSGAQYEPLDLVSYQGGGYVARRDVQGVAPTPGDDWQQIAMPGADGSGNATWYAGTAVSGRGTGIVASVPSSGAGDMYLNSQTSDLYRATAPDTWDWVMRLADAVAVTAADVLVGEDGDTVETVLDEHTAAIVDLEGRTAEDIPTTEPGVSVQGALERHTAAISDLEGRVAVDIPTTEPGVSVQAALDKKMKLDLLWSGAWGAAGSSPITVPNINSYSRIAIIAHSNMAFSNRATSIYAGVMFASNGSILFRAYALALSDTTLSLVYALSTQAAPAGSALVVTDNTSNGISAIYGIA